MSPRPPRAPRPTPPEPFSNIGLSLLGDAFVPASLWLSWTHPVALAVVLFVALVAAIVAIVVLGSSCVRCCVARPVSCAVPIRL